MDSTVQNMHNRIIPAFSDVNQIQRPEKSGNAAQQTSFGQILKDEVLKQDGVKFSMHAQERIRMRNISLNQHEVDRLNKGINQVAGKGGHESLILMDNSAFLVNVQNKTVITAIDGENLKENVFTNIDSAIIV